MEPKSIALMVAAILAVVGLFGFVGFELARIPPSPIEVYVHFDQPIVIKVVPK